MNAVDLKQLALAASHEPEQAASLRISIFKCGAELVELVNYQKRLA